MRSARLLSASYERGPAGDMKEQCRSDPSFGEVYFYSGGGEGETGQSVAFVRCPSKEHSWSSDSLTRRLWRGDLILSKRGGEEAESAVQLAQS